MSEFVYVLTNEAMPGIVKIGHTENLEQRIKKLDSTPLPLPFECHYAARVSNARQIEGILHNLFAEHRIRPNREFFRLSPEKVVTALSLCPHEDATPRQTGYADEEEQRAVQETKARRDRINLRAIGIPVGAELVFSRDAEQRCKVVNDYQIEFQGQLSSLSRAALTLLQQRGYSQSSVSGSVFWMYEGEALDERRQRLENQQFDAPASIAS